MSAGMWGVILFLIAAGSLLTLIWHMTKPEPEEPPGATIHLTHQLNQHGRLRTRWHYLLEDHRSLRSSGYLTRRSAVRAAQTELDRLQRKDQATQ